MNQVIVFKFNESLCVIYPSGVLSITDTALKDVPAGLPFKIVSIDALPTDRTYRDAWDMDMSNPDGIGQGPSLVGE